MRSQASAVQTRTGLQDSLRYQQVELLPRRASCCSTLKLSISVSYRVDVRRPEDESSSRLTCLLTGACTASMVVARQQGGQGGVEDLKRSAQGTFQTRSMVSVCKFLTTRGRCDSVSESVSLSVLSNLDINRPCSGNEPLRYHLREGRSSSESKSNKDSLKCREVTASTARWHSAQIKVRKRAQDGYCSKEGECNSSRSVEKPRRHLTNAQRRV